MHMIVEIKTKQVGGYGKARCACDVFLTSEDRQSAWTLPGNMQQTLIIWCNDSFGRDSKRWQIVQNMFHFAHQRDLMLFVARWHRTDYEELQRITWEREAA